MNNFHSALRTLAPLSDMSLTELMKICTVQELKKNDFLLSLDTVTPGMYFILKGLVRIFYYKNDKEVSEWFCFENNFCFSILSYFKKKPSHLMIQCIEDSKVITISREGLDQLRKHNFEIAELVYSMISGALILSQDRMANIQFETATQRYASLLNMHKAMIQRIPLSYLASYLGVSAETLSRIRAQVI